MPWDSTAERESATLGNEAGDTRASLAAKWQAQQEELGLGEGASNPYSHASQLSRERDANQRGITNTAGANLYAGSTVNAQRTATRQYDEGLGQLTAAYDRSKAAYERGTGQTDRDYQLGVSKIKEGAINRALESEPAPLAPGPGRVRPARAGGRPAPRRVAAPRRAPARRAPVMVTAARGGRGRRR